MSEVFCKVSNQKSYPFILPDLPFARDGLDPYYSEKILSLHHGKHHQAYVTKLNNLLNDKHDLKSLSLEEIMQKTVNDVANVGLFNNAAQIWNHTFFWNCLRIDGGGEPTGEIADHIRKQFVSFDKFVEEFSVKAVGLFGSGWCWLAVDNDNNLKIVQKLNAGNPLTDNMRPILTLDVWEHAYYPDYENRRPEFVKMFFSKLVNWDFVNQVYMRGC